MTQHSLTPECERIIQRGGLVLADLLDSRCRLPDWEAKLANGETLVGSSYCPECEYRHTTVCHSAAVSAHYLIYWFCAWVDENDERAERENARRKEKAVTA